MEHLKRRFTASRSSKMLWWSRPQACPRIPSGKTKEIVLSFVGNSSWSCVCSTRLLVDILFRALFELCFFLRSVWLFVTLVYSALFSLCLIVCYISDFSLCSVWLFFTLESRVLFRMCSVLLFVALVLTHCLECVLFESLWRLCLFHCFICVLFDSLSRQCLAHCFVCVLFDCLSR